MMFGYDQRCILTWGSDMQNRPEHTEKEDGQSGLEVRIKMETQI